MAGAIFASAAGAVLAVTLTPAAEVRVEGRDVRVRDVADVSGVEAMAVSSVVIARLSGSSPRRISRARLADLVRRAIPGSEVHGDLKGMLTLQSEAPAVHLNPRPYSADGPIIERGQKLTLTSAAGSVVIQRPVVALQSATPAKPRVFVRTADGEVFAATVDSGGAK